MINLSARCPSCEEVFRSDVQVGEPLTCPHCGRNLHDSAPDFEANPHQCLACPSDDLFVRKDFPQRIGVMIVVTGFAASSVAWYYHQIFATFAILFATALIDLLLYVLVGNVLECYRCHAQYRGLRSLDEHEGFDLEVHEKFRQQEARMKEHARVEAARQAHAASEAPPPQASSSQAAAPETPSSQT